MAMTAEEQQLLKTLQSDVRNLGIAVSALTAALIYVRSQDRGDELELAQAVTAVINKQGGASTSAINALAEKLAKALSEQAKAPTGKSPTRIRS